MDVVQIPCDALDLLQLPYFNGVFLPPTHVACAPPSLMLVDCTSP